MQPSVETKPAQCSICSPNASAAHWKSNSSRAASSGIVNDANDWAVETMSNPRYPLELFQRVVTVSLETMRIARGLPALEL